MLRLALALVAVGGWATAAEAQHLGVGSTRPDDGAMALVIELLPGEVAPLSTVPSSFEPEDFLPFTRASGLDVVLVLDRPTQRLYLAVAADGRVLERVLPAAAEDYVIALAASELVELATGLADPPVPEPEHDAPPDVLPAPEPEAPPLRGFVYAGANGWMGFPTDLRGLGATLGGTYVTGGRLGAFVDVAGTYGGAFDHTVSVGTTDLALAYRRHAVRLAAGLSLRLRERLWLGYGGVATLEIVDVDAHATGGSAPRDGGDLHVTATVGVTAELRLLVGRHGFVGLSWGLDALLGRTPYTAFGTRVLTEESLRQLGRVILGASF